MEKTQEILKHIFNLYDENEPTDEDVINWCEKNMERYKAWEESFRDYDINDVCKAINIYWRRSNDRTKPKVARILALLETEKDVKKIQHHQSTGERYFNIEHQYMQRDKALGINKEYFLADYSRTVNYILNDLLREKIGNYEYSKLSKDDKVAELSEKYELAMRNGLFNDFDEILKQLNPKESTGNYGSIKDLKSAWSF